MQLQQRYEMAIKLLETCGLDAADLRGQQARLGDPLVQVYLAGSFAAGKSTLLNRLAGVDLLPVGPQLPTDFPAAVRFGSPAAWVQRAGVRQSVGLREAATERFDRTGVTRLEAFSDSPFFAQVPHLQFVDLPGLDSPAVEGPWQLPAVFTETMALVLVFSAEEPVVKQSLQAALAGVTVPAKQLYVVLTKCDKVPAETARQGAAYLKHALEEILQVSRLKVLTVRVGAAPDTRLLEQVICALEAQAGELADRESLRLLEAALQAPADLLALQQETVSLPQNQREKARAAAEQELESLQGKLENHTRQLAEELDAAGSTVEQQVLAMAKGLAPLALKMLDQRQNAAEYLDQVLQERVKASLVQEWMPVWRSRLRAIAALAGSHTIARQAAGEQVQAGQSFATRLEELAAQDLTDRVPQALVGCGPVLQLFERGRGGKRSRRGEAETAASQLEALLAEYVATRLPQAMGALAEKSCGAVSALIEQELAQRRAELEQAGSGLPEAEDDAKTQRLAKAQQLLRCLRAAEPTQDEERTHAD